MNTRKKCTEGLEKLRNARTKRFWWAKGIVMQLCLVAILVCGATQAKADFLGTLNRNESWSLEFMGLGAGPVDVTGATVTFIDSRGRQDVDVFTIPIGGDANTLVYNNANIGSHIRRIIINLDFPLDSDVGTLMSVWQGAERPNQPPWRFPIVSHLNRAPRYVFNVVAAP